MIGDNQEVLNDLEAHPEITNLCTSYKILYIYIYAIGVGTFVQDDAYRPEYVCNRQDLVNAFGEMLAKEETQPVKRYVSHSIAASQLGDEMARASMAGEERVSVGREVGAGKALDLATVPGYMRGHRKSKSIELNLPRGGECSQPPCTWAVPLG
jgi:hypothetical protein